MAPKTDWNPVLRDELAKPYWGDLQRFVADERARHPVYPPADEVFAALHLTPYADVKVVILGQDPYHGAGQAHGLCFSVRPGVPPPPSLQNIFTELHDDLGLDPPDHGCLDAWSRQGVLLLNTTLTVRARRAASHQGKGWERFTDRIVGLLNERREGLVFLLWGSDAKRRARRIHAPHVALQAGHPSPLSVRHFRGCGHFSSANAILGPRAIDWTAIGRAKARQ